MNDLSRRIADLTRENAAMRATMARLRDDGSSVPAAERERIDQLQARADSLAAMRGEASPAPWPSERFDDYSRRVAQRFQGFSGAWGGTRLDSLSGLPLYAATEEILADAEALARAGEGMNGRLVAVRHDDAAGRPQTTFFGDPLRWMAPFMRPGAICEIRRELTKLG